MVGDTCHAGLWAMAKAWHPAGFARRWAGPDWCVNSAPWCHQPIARMRRLKQRGGTSRPTCPPSEGHLPAPSALSTFASPSVAHLFGVSFPPVESKLPDRWDCGSLLHPQGLGQCQPIVGAPWTFADELRTDDRQPVGWGGWCVGGSALKVPCGVPGPEPT